MANSTGISEERVLMTKSAERVSFYLSLGIAAGFLLTDEGIADVVTAIKTGQFNIGYATFVRDRLSELIERAENTENGTQNNRT